MGMRDWPKGDSAGGRGAALGIGVRMGSTEPVPLPGEPLLPEAAQVSWQTGDVLGER